MRVAIYPGTFDPITNGHIDLVKRSLNIFDRVIIAVGVNPQKEPLFSGAQRLEMISEAVRDIERADVDCFTGLLVEYVKSKNAVAIIRGLRAMSDFEYEFQMALMNRRIERSVQPVETVFMLPSEEYVYLTSSVVKEVARYGGDVSEFVPPVILKQLRERFNQ